MQCSESRRLGVLLHPTALPEAPVCGGFGAEARHWLQAMARHGLEPVARLRTKTTTDRSLWQGCGMQQDTETARL